VRRCARLCLWLFALTLALAFVARQVRVVFVVRTGWLQLVGMVLFLAVVIYLLVDWILARLGR